MIANPRQYAALHKRSGLHRDLARVAPASRTCVRCKQLQPIESFRLNAKGQRNSYCRGCALEVTQEWRQRNRSELNARRRAAYAERKTVHSKSAPIDPDTGLPIVAGRS